ncbi:MAG: DUF362 domain-containing protein [Planctomycetota bacterium]
MNLLKGLGLSFEESMAGHLGVGATDPEAGLQQGQADDTPLRFDARIVIDDLRSFLDVSDHEARLEGTVTFQPLGGTFEMQDGRFNLFSIDPETGQRQMVYAFRFTAGDGQTYYLEGHKWITDDPGEVDVVEDMTRLFTVVHQGKDADAPVYGAGELYFDLSDAPELVSSLQITGHPSFWQEVAARIAFASFAFGALRTEYLGRERLLYESRYENLVLSGTVDADGESRPFFLASGAHEEGFPWGDGEAFWDVLLVVGDGDGGWQRYCISDRVLEGLQLDVAGGTYRYQGPIYRVSEGNSASFSDMRKGSKRLEECTADIELRFNATPHDTVPYPFPVVSKLSRKLTSDLRQTLQQVLPSEHPLGVHITPHAVRLRSGTFNIETPGNAGSAGREYALNRDDCYGEAERTTFRNLKEPTLLYGYFCALDPTDRFARVQIHTRTLRNEREDWAKDRLDACLGEVLSRSASGEMVVRPDRLGVSNLDPRQDSRAHARLLQRAGEPLLEVNNDHYPTADFLRRIVRVRTQSGHKYLALEENMRQLRLGAVNSSEQATVVSIQGEDKFDALDRALDEAGFTDAVERRRAETGSSREEFRLAIKPNFMFAYSRHDPTTFTDPELVKHLARRLQEMGFREIALVEAQSTYGQYFDKRSVPEMADYLGYADGDLYRVVDLTEEAEGSRGFGSHLGEHPVPPTWRDADFRISFAKNKTHAYSYYTLTLKNIYGSLPMANKFKEYHCGRDIYHTTLEWLEAFPVHFALIDAWLSADGPFGVFADTAPNETRTIIGGENPVAVDWVGAGKMGIDPMVSTYMRLAVERFGKPQISLAGDATHYRPWLNVPAALPLFTHHGFDADYHFGNLLYAAAAQMDEEHFTHKKMGPLTRVLRWLSTPLRRALFVRTAQNPTWLNRALSWMFYRMGY